MEYMTVEHYDPKAFDDKLNAAVADGWEPVFDTYRIAPQNVDGLAMGILVQRPISNT